MRRQQLSVVFAPVLLGLALAGRAWAADPVLVELEARARVPGGVVRLGDVARLGSAARTALAWLSLGRAPEAGSRRTIEANEVRDALAAAGFTASSVSVRGAVRVVIESESVALSGKTIAEIARRFALGALQTAGAELELEAAAPLAAAEVDVPIGRESSALRPRWLAGAPLPSAASVVVAVEVLIDGETRATVEQGFRVRRFERVLVPVRAIAKGEALDGRAFDLVRTERTGATEDQVVERGDLAGATARRDLKVGVAFTRADIALPLLVKKGEHVSVTITKGSLRVVGEGTALRDAARGETVPVKTSAGHEPLVGRAVSEGKVEVSLDTALPASSSSAPDAPAAAGAPSSRHGGKP